MSDNFKDNNLICCMCLNSDSIYKFGYRETLFFSFSFSIVSSKTSAVEGASKDFMPREPAFQNLHIASVAFNSLLLGEIFVPDWDMFHVISYIHVSLLFKTFIMSANVNESHDMILISMLQQEQ